MAKTTRSTRRRVSDRLRSSEVTPDAVVSISNAGSSPKPDAVLSSHAEACPSPVKSHPSPVKSKVQSSSKRKLSLPSPVKSSLSHEKRKSKRPTADECKFVVGALGAIHPDVMEENDRRRDGFIERKKKKKQKNNTANCTPVTDAVISTMLSQNTTAANQNRAFAGLKEAFPGGYEEVATADTSIIEGAIRDWRL